MSVHPVQAVGHLAGLHGAGRPRAAPVAAPAGRRQPAGAGSARRLADGRPPGPDGRAEGGRLRPGAVRGAAGGRLLPGADLPRGPDVVVLWLLPVFAPALHAGLRPGDEASVGPAAAAETRAGAGERQMLEAAGEGAEAPLHRDGAHRAVRLVQPAGEPLQHRLGLRVGVGAGRATGPGPAGAGPGRAAAAVRALRRDAGAAAVPVPLAGPGLRGLLLLLLRGVSPRRRLLVGLLRLHRRHLRFSILPVSLGQRGADEGGAGPGQGLSRGSRDALLRKNLTVLRFYTRRHR